MSIPEIALLVIQLATVGCWIAIAVLQAKTRRILRETERLLREHEENW